MTVDGALAGVSCLLKVRSTSFEDYSVMQACRTRSPRGWRQAVGEDEVEGGR